jgi:hypothetical protein
MPRCIHEIEESWCGNCNPARGPESPLAGWIDDVSLVIPGDGEAPIALDDLALVSGHTRDEVNQAVAAMRERYPELPLVSDCHGIRFTMDGEAVRRFRRAGATQAMTLIRRRFRGAVIPALTGDEAAIRRVTRQVDRLLEDIEELLV